MDPIIGRVAFTMGFLVFVLALLLLPALDPDSRSSWRMRWR
ncbi:MAG: hypothetical protein M5R40_11855 [Anaerolineae bacterium]|nr:hypothetical protein [Anaerolineae bacterium]